MRPKHNFKVQTRFCCSSEVKRTGENVFCGGSKVLAAMISILAQERLIGAAVGSILTGVVVLDQRRRIYSSIAHTKPQSVTNYQSMEPIFGKKYRSELAHLWNKTVDETFRPVIKSLSSSGW